MIVHTVSLTVDLGESGYLIGFTDDYDYPAEMPYGWRCGPAADASAVVLTTTDTGPLNLTVEIHDTPPDNAPSGGWEAAEELSLHVDLPTLHLATLEQGDIVDAWPDDEPPVRLPVTRDSGAWARMRLYCYANDPEPGIGDHGERHLLQLWPAPPAPPIHPEISDADRQARSAYVTARATLVDEYTSTYTITLSGHRE
ncbi:hypothetical protein [Streptomyces tricolor]|uniref:hypothetical protein n=1 Tax=Streptomyces tricolor TaxID=68277 RepID=UPI0036EA5764